VSSNASSKHPIPVSAQKKAALYRLTNPPAIAWPTLSLLIVIVLGIVTSDVLALEGAIPLWVSACVNVFFMYPIFHVAHDATHRSASSNVQLNDWMGRIALLMIAPQVSLSTFRYSHMIHHRFTNEESDPDHYAHGPWWSLFFRWMTFDLSYAVYNWRSGDPRGLKTLKDTFPLAAMTLVVVALLVYLGYGLQVLMLWFIPARLTTALIGFVFLWLPHLNSDGSGTVQHITTAAPTHSNLTAGTTIRLGHEPLMDVLMQWHNYHLIHHLWPTTPSYNHRKVWQLMEPELRERDLRIQHGFALLPTFYPAGSTAAATH